MSETSTLIGYQGRTISRQELALIPTPTHVPVPHHEIVQALVETLGFRHIHVTADEYAVSPDGMKMFGVLDLETEMHGCRFAIGLRNSHDRSMRLALTCGLRVTVCSNMAFSGDLAPVRAKASHFATAWQALASGSVQCWRYWLRSSDARLCWYSENNRYCRPPNLNSLNERSDNFALDDPVCIVQSVMETHRNFDKLMEPDLTYRTRACLFSGGLCRDLCLRPIHRAVNWSF